MNRLIDIDSVVATDRDSRKKLIKLLNKHGRQLLFKGIKTLTDILELDKVATLEERTSKRHDYIEQHPGVIYWDFAELVDHDGTHSLFPNLIISTNGDTVNFTKDGALWITANTDSHRDSYKTIKVKERTKLLINRMMGTTFIKPGPHLDSWDISDLFVNHQNRMKWDNARSNLEWVTPRGNIRHGFGEENYHEYEYYLVEVIIDNGFLGRKFVINRSDYTITDRFDRLTSHTGYRGFVGKNIPNEEINKYHYGVPTDILALWVEDKDYFTPTKQAMIGEVMEGPHKGTLFSFFGFKEAKRYFHHSGLINQLNGKAKLTRGCQFKRVTHREALPYRCIMNDTILKTLTKESDTYGGKRLTKEELARKFTPYECEVCVGVNKGYKFYITSVDERNEYFKVNAIRHVVTGYRNTHRGCIFIKTNWNSVPDNYPKMTDEIIQSIDVALNN